MNLLKKLFPKVHPIAAQETWVHTFRAHVGGLTEIGFSLDEATILVVSHQGRGLYNVSDGRRLARDDEAGSIDSDWLDASRRVARGIGTSEKVWYPVVGLWGGALATQIENWAVEIKTAGRDEFAYLVNTVNGEKWLVDKPITEIKAFGFSGGGRHLALATSSDLDVYQRAIRAE